MRPLLTAVAALVACGPAVADEGGKLPWKKDPAAAIKEAAKDGKPMMLYFTSEG
jgi:hypothetical protein